MKKSTLFLAFMLVTAPAYGAGRLNLTWTDNSDNELGFKVERRQGPTGTFAEIAQTPVNAVTFADTTPDLQEYCYRVRAFNDAGDSIYSNEDCGIPSLIIVIPDGPTDLLITTP